MVINVFWKIVDIVLWDNIYHKVKQHLIFKKIIKFLFQVNARIVKKIVLFAKIHKHVIIETQILKLQLQKHQKDFIKKKDHLNNAQIMLKNVLLFKY